jgi:hypothetical protein
VVVPNISEFRNGQPLVRREWRRRWTGDDGDMMDPDHVRDHNRYAGSGIKRTYQIGHRSHRRAIQTKAVFPFLTLIFKSRWLSSSRSNWSIVTP